MSDPTVLTVPEAAAMLRVSEWTVAQMTRDGRLRKVPLIRRIRIPLAAVLELTEGGYSDQRGESDRPPSQEATPSRRGYGRAAKGPLAREAVGSGGPVHGRVGPTPADVVIRRVETGSR